MPEKVSYLASVKAELRQLVDELTHEDDIDVDGITNRIWKFIEPKMKESFFNGKKSGNGKLHSDERRPANPFRRS